jgi:ferritin
MTISNKMQNLINDQIQKEFFSEYFYLSMQAYFTSINLDGFANFFAVQTQEEHAHGMLFFDYVLETGGKITLQQIEQPQNNFESPIQVFQMALEHEKKVTASIYNLVDASLAEKDYTSHAFLQWFITEQREEESTLDKIIGKLKLIGDDGKGLLMMDTELAARTFTPPVIGNNVPQN